jgi:hypothetical protein
VCRRQRWNRIKRFNIDKLRYRACANRRDLAATGGVARGDPADAACAVEPEKPQGS